MGERIKQLRKEKGMTQIALAQVLHVTKGTVSTWETNRHAESTLCPATAYSGHISIKREKVME